MTYTDDIDLLDDDELQAEAPAPADAAPQRYEHWKVEVDAGQAPVRIDKFLAEKMQHSSRNRIQTAADNKNLQVDMVYLNILQETQQLLSVMRHQLRSAKKFMEN